MELKLTFEINSNSINSNYFYQPFSSEEIAQKVVKNEISLTKKRDGSCNVKTPSFFQKSEEDWEDLKKGYLAMENYLREHPEEIPQWEVTGPLHYGMSLTQMKAVALQTFQTMAQSGRIIREETLSKFRDRSSFNPQKTKGSNNLVRIWGAQFLKKSLENSPSFNVPEHYLIIEDGATEIEVTIALSSSSPYTVLSSVKHAYILSERVEGEEKASDYEDSPELKKVNYCDFGDMGNILQDSNGRH